MKNTTLEVLADKLTCESLQIDRAKVNFREAIDLFQATTTLQYMLRDLAKLDPEMTVKDLASDFKNLVRVYIEMYIRNDRPQPGIPLENWKN